MNFKSLSYVISTPISSPVRAFEKEPYNTLDAAQVNDYIAISRGALRPNPEVYRTIRFNFLCENIHCLACSGMRNMILDGWSGAVLAGQDEVGEGGGEEGQEEQGQGCHPRLKPTLLLVLLQSEGYPNLFTIRCKKCCRKLIVRRQNIRLVLAPIVVCC